MRAGPSIEDQLRYLEEQLLQPDMRKSAAFIAALPADDFVEFGSSGRVFNKKDIIEALPHEGDIHYTLSEFSALQLASNVVQVTYRAARQDNASESPIYSLRSSIWKFADGRWQMVFHQGTLAKNE